MTRKNSRNQFVVLVEDCHQWCYSYKRARVLAKALCCICAFAIFTNFLNMTIRSLSLDAEASRTSCRWNGHFICRTKSQFRTTVCHDEHGTNPSYIYQKVRAPIAAWLKRLAEFPCSHELACKNNTTDGNPQLTQQIDFCCFYVSFLQWVINWTVFYFYFCCFRTRNKSHNNELVTCDRFLSFQPDRRLIEEMLRQAMSTVSGAKVSHSSSCPWNPVRFYKASTQYSSVSETEV